jgi:hypothetical protein
VKDAFAGGTHQLRLGCLERRERAFLVAGRNGRLTSRTAVRICDRRDLLTAVRRAILRVALRADLVLAIGSSCARDRDCGVPTIKTHTAEISPRHFGPGLIGRRRRRQPLTL